MARSGPVAVQGSGRPGPQQHAHDADKAPSSHRHDITPEVFRRFMTYERTLLPKDASPTPTYAELTASSPIIEPGLLPPPTFGDSPNHTQGYIGRAIRGMPRRALNASESSLARASAQEQAGLPRLVADDDTIGSNSHTHASPQTPDGSSSSHALSTANGMSGTLSQHFQQLRISSHEPLRASGPTTSTSSPSTVDPAKAAVDNDTSASHFRFPSLPAKLTDDGFHYRQRAAQFILLYSQQASPENLAKYNHLSSPLSYGIYDASSSTTPSGYSRRGAANPGASLHAVDESGCSAALDDDESIHSHHHGHNASDDEAEYLDFEACRTAHLGNKKKRKSSRFSSPALAALAPVSSLDHSQTDAAGVSPQDAPGTPSDANAQGRSRALVDTTNTFRQASAQAYDVREGKHQSTANAPTKLPPVRRPTFVRLPPRQTSGEHQKAALRGRIRARLAPIFHQRRLDRIQEEARQRQERQAMREAQGPQSQAPADAETHSPTTQEKRAPPKRTSKAGKRAQAIRGSSSAAKPLTIAEIRARAAAASAAGGAQADPKASAVQTSGSASPTKSASSVNHRSIGSKDAATKTPLPPSAGPGQLASKPSPRSSEGPKKPVQTTGPGSVASAGNPPSNGKLAPPASSFDFRMSSAVTLRLRELRSQLDAATRNLSDTARQGDTHAVAKALSQAVAAPPSAPAPAPNSRRTEAAEIPAKHGDGLPDHAPPWVRHALEFQYQQEQQQRLEAQAHQARQAGNTAGAASLRSGSSTPAQQAKPTSSAAPPKTRPPASPARTKAKAPGGRRTVSRKPAEAAHQHGAACKHGHGRPHGAGSALFTDDDWICIFCEYELYYGEVPLMLRACRNRKKLVEKKSKAKTKAQAALQKKSTAKSNGTGCPHQHDHDHDHHHYHHDHDHHHGCEHDHDHGCQHDHGSEWASDDHDHDHRHQPDRGNDARRPSRQRHQPHGHHHEADDDAHRERCDCGNSIHSSDFDDEGK